MSDDKRELILDYVMLNTAGQVRLNGVRLSETLKKENLEFRCNMSNH